MEEIIWRNGEKPIKSTIKDKYLNTVKVKDNEILDCNANSNINMKIENNIDINTDNNKDINENFVNNSSNNLFKSENFRNTNYLNKDNTKRDNANDRLNERILISSGVSNPFLTNNNYIDDLETQENFLRPQKS